MLKVILMSSYLFNKTILLAEDELISNENVSYVLKKHFRRVISCSNGNDAYTQYLKHKPDIVITDIEMPSMNGLDFIKKVREVETNDTPVFIMTSFTHQHYLLEALNLQPLSYLVKPLTRNSFKVILEKIEKHFMFEKHDLFFFTDDIYYDYNKKIVLNDKKIISLTHQEISLLEMFIQYKNILVSYEDIEIVLDIESSKNYNTIKSAVSRLRKKLPAFMIKTIYAEGYKLSHE